MVINLTWKQNNETCLKIIAKPRSNYRNKPKSLGIWGRLQTDNFHGVDNSKTSDMCGIPPPDAIVMLIFWALEGGVAQEVVNA